MPWHVTGNAMRVTARADSHILRRLTGKEAALNDLELMKLKAAALFTHDAGGRIVTSNESDPTRAPRLFLGRTRDGNIWRFRDDLSAELVSRLEQVLAIEPPLGDPQRRPATFDTLCEVLAEEEPVSKVWEGPAWHFPETSPAFGNATAMGSDNEEMLRQHYPWTAGHLDEVWPCFAVVEDGVGVAICFSARLTPDAAEAGVDTAEAFRGKGYAPRVVAAWAHAIRESGRTPIYSTSWDNLASQGVARKLGLLLFGAELSLY
jgi:RimJ/RimL family protein N-acetyltransferase